MVVHNIFAGGYVGRLSQVGTRAEWSCKKLTLSYLVPMVVHNIFAAGCCARADLGKSAYVLQSTNSYPFFRPYFTVLLALQPPGKDNNVRFKRTTSSPFIDGESSCG